MLTIQVDPLRGGESDFQNPIVLVHGLSESAVKLLHGGATLHPSDYGISDDAWNIVHNLAYLLPVSFVLGLMRLTPEPSVP